MSFHRIDLVGKEVDTWLGIKELAVCNFVSINLRSNELRDFEHFGTHPYLLELHLHDNNIHSFYGLTKQRSLKVLNLRGNPLASHPFYRIMALMVVGYSVTTIDGVDVTEEEYEIARRTKPQAAVAVSYGWLFDVRTYSTDVLNDIVGECKLAQKERKRTFQPKTSIVNALEGLLFPQTAAALQAKKKAVEPIRKSDVIQRLTKRITELEKEVQARKAKESKALSARDKDATTAVATTFGALTSGQLGCVSSFTFAQNVLMQSNINSTTGFRRVCLQLDPKKLHVLEFFSRDLVFEVPISTIVCAYQPPSHLLVSDEFGASMDLCFEKKGTLSAFYTALHLLQGRPAPPINLSAEDRADDESLRGSVVVHESGAAAFGLASQAAAAAPTSQKSRSAKASGAASEVGLKSPKASLPRSRGGAGTPSTSLHSPASSHANEVVGAKPGDDDDGAGGGSAHIQEAPMAPAVSAAVVNQVQEPPKREAAAAAKPLSRFANFVVSDSDADDAPVKSAVISLKEGGGGDSTRESVKGSAKDSAQSSVIFREENRNSFVEAGPQGNAVAASVVAATPTGGSILFVPDSVKNSFNVTGNDSVLSLQFRELSTRTTGDQAVVGPATTSAAPAAAVPAAAPAPPPPGQTGNRVGRFQSLMIESDSD